ncbi:MAG: hypothetical protein OXL41_10485 [Nitrospinae bacterium]|nr:hypothetical protein [Nitrospinota bacterium]
MKYIPVLFVMSLLLTACYGSGVVPPAEDRIQLERNTEFDGESLRFFVTLPDGKVASVNTTDDAIQAAPGMTPVPGHQAQTWTFLKVTDDATTVAHSLVSWDPDDPADYLVAGWWAEFPDQKPPLTFKGSVQYAIIDGPELDHGFAPQLPVEGTATYAGPAGGLYAYEAGSGWGENEGEFVLEEYQGTITLTADFTDRTLKGCIGCVGDLVTQRGHFGVFLGEELGDVQGIAKDYEIHLATAILREDGTFDRDRVTLKHPERTVTLAEGYWGGSVSSRQDTDGNPRLVAGFSGLDFEESDGSEGVLVGSFVALSETFRQNGVSRFPPPQDK